MELTEQAVSLVEGIFENYLKENPDDLVDKLLASHPEIFAGLADGTGVKFFDTKNTADVLTEKIGLVPIDMIPKPQENAAEEISEEVGVVQIPAELIPFGGRWINPSFTGGAGGGGSVRLTTSIWSGANRPVSVR